VSHGQTNRQIAARLYLSEKTIEAHLSKLYAQRGVPSRAAMVAQLGELDRDSEAPRPGVA
jgi:DNA-binding NarL/FixJ family response regulator